MPVPALATPPLAQGSVVHLCLDSAIAPHVATPIEGIKDDGTTAILVIYNTSRSTVESVYDSGYSTNGSWHLYSDCGAS